MKRNKDDFILCELFIISVSTGCAILAYLFVQPHAAKVLLLALFSVVSVRSLLCETFHRQYPHRGSIARRTAAKHF